MTEFNFRNWRWLPSAAWLFLTLASLSGPCSIRAAQPDYTNAFWRQAYPGHWYTSGSAHAFVVEHDMEGYYWSVISYFQQSSTDASIHFCVNGLQNGSDPLGHAENNPADPPAGEITQMVEEQYWAWHARCWNRYMFGTEHEGFVTSPVWYSEALYQASGKLTRYLCDKYNIPKDRNHIIGHNEWQTASWRAWMTNNWPQIDPTCNDHTDPGQYWDWNKFMSIVAGVPTITAQPFSRLVQPGSNTIFTVAASGSPPLTYQWFKNGNPVAGGTQSSLPLNNVQASAVAGYSVSVSGPSGSVTSRVATLSLSPIWISVFLDNFETNSSTNYDLFWAAGDAVPDYTADWGFDFSTNQYSANGVITNIPPPPGGGGSHALKMTANKNDDVAATAGVSVYPRGLIFSNDYCLRFDMWINYNGGAGGGSGSTEFATFGINHSDTEINWTTASSASDGLWFAVDGEGGGAGGDYRAYAGNGAAPPTQLSFGASGLAASGATVDDGGDALFRALFPSPAYETTGSPGKHWVRCEICQISNVITWQMNGVIVAQRTNSSPYRSGVPMLGYMDPFSSLANPPADNFVLYDNLQVLVAAPQATVANLQITPRSHSAVISWSSLIPTLCDAEYGLAPGYGSRSSMENAPRLLHKILLNGLTETSLYAVRLHSRIGTAEFISSPVIFSTDVSVIVDNPAAQYTGDWIIGNSSPDQYGGFFQYTPTAAGSATAQAAYVPTIVTPGLYDVYAWYPAGPNRSTNAAVSILARDGFMSTSLNESSGGGEWRLVRSSVGFSAGTNGVLTLNNSGNDTNHIVAADAFRFTYSNSQDISPGTVPAWWSQFYFGSDFVDPSLDHDLDGLTAAQEYILGTDPLVSSSRLVSTWSRVGTNFQLDFSPCLGGRLYELQASPNLASNSWVTLTNPPTIIYDQGSFTIPMNPSPTPRFYRVSVRLAP